MDKEDAIHIYDGILLNHEKEQNNANIATWMQLEIITKSEVSQKDKDKYVITYMWNIKYGTYEPTY